MLFFAYTINQSSFLLGFGYGMLRVPRGISAMVSVSLVDKLCNYPELS